ncbi:MAG: phage/plasmid primase, P4 family [Actinomycetota bacterium]|nr:phage/plasmid primase, P4 family [Actinomycetota bacterium]
MTTETRWCRVCGLDKIDMTDGICSDCRYDAEVTGNDASATVTDGADDLIVPSPNNPMAVARMFVAGHFADPDGSLMLRHHRGGFYTWDGTCWPEGEDRKVRADLYRWLEPAVYWKDTKDGSELAPFEPTRNKIANLVEALQAVAHLDAAITPPAWLEAHDLPASEVVAMANGVLHVPSRTLLPHSPALFVHHSLPFEFAPNAPEPERWHRFLDELWGDDFEAIDTLGEKMGYVLSGDTRQQKLFMLVGPKRSGKGTIGRVLTGLLGPHNVAAPTLAGLATNFGLSPIIGKPLALVSDARLSNRSDSMVAVERLLSVSGEDSLTIDRKYREPWTGRLGARFLILTNELPRFTDSSGALASRFVLLTLVRSFYDREDPTLTDTLLSEAPGIFNWALRGLDRLRERGHFQMPASAREALRQLEDLSSPTGAFVRDRCEVGPALEVDKDVLYEDWKTWCEREGKARAGSKAVFIRDLRAAVPGMHAARPRDGGDRHHVIRGLELRKQLTGPLTTPDQEAGGGW